MKVCVGVSVFNKQDMIRWILEGIRDSFDCESTKVVFHFEACCDKSVDNFCALKDSILGNFKTPVDHIVSPNHVLEQGAHRLLINQFMASNCDILIIPHDDNKFMGRRLVSDIQDLLDAKGIKNVGWIGGRDGYGYNYDKIISSPFSASNIARDKVSIGEYQPRLMLNTGPNVYTRHLVDTIGLPDNGMDWYWWDDYSLRAHEHGLTNYLLGMDCLHEKFGQVGNNHVLYEGSNVAKGLKMLNDRWASLHGRNVI